MFHGRFRGKLAVGFLYGKSFLKGKIRSLCSNCGKLYIDLKVM